MTFFLALLLLLSPAKTCPNNAWTIDKIIAENRKVEAKREAGRLWMKVIKAEENITLLYLVFEKSPVGAQLTFKNGCLAISKLDLISEALLREIGGITWGQAFPKGTAL